MKTKFIPFRRHLPALALAAASGLASGCAPMIQWVKKEPALLDAAYHPTRTDFFRTISLSSEHGFRRERVTFPSQYHFTRPQPVKDGLMLAAKGEDHSALAFYRPGRDERVVEIMLPPANLFAGWCEYAVAMKRGGRNLSLIDLDTGTVQTKKHLRAIDGLIPLDDRRLALLTRDETLDIMRFDPTDPSPWIQTISIPTPPVFSESIRSGWSAWVHRSVSPDGRYIAFFSDQNTSPQHFVVVDTSDGTTFGEETMMRPGRESPFQENAFTADGTLLRFTWDGCEKKLAGYDMGTHELRWKWDETLDRNERVMHLGSHILLASGSDRSTTWRIVDGESGKETHSMALPYPLHPLLRGVPLGDKLACITIDAVLASHHKIVLPVPVPFEEGCSFQERLLLVGGDETSETTELDRALIANLEGLDRATWFGIQPFLPIGPQPRVLPRGWITDLGFDPRQNLIYAFDETNTLHAVFP